MAGIVPEVADVGAKLHDDVGGPAVTLRLRLIVRLAAALALTLALAAALACADAIRSVRTELMAALVGATQSATELVAELPQAGDPAAGLASAVFTFNGSRHIRAVLLDADGIERARSRLALPADAPPTWFVWLVRPELTPRRLAVGAFTLVLSADPVNEVSEVWTGFGDDAISLATFCALAAVLTLTTVTRALRPLAELSAAFPRLAEGAWETRVPERGPPELVRLTRGFNEMAARLAAAEAWNRRLQEQFQTLQDEERAELARDLHDEIGPYLFAANLAATSIREGAERESKAALAEEARNLQNVIGHMQQKVRALLRRLRPTPAADLGLVEAIGSLAAFWRARDPGPQIRLDLNLPAEPDATTAAALYRCVQEGLANALRHGRPAVVEVSVRAETGGFVACVADDGAGAGEEPADGGFGLVGMRERVTALGGSVEAGPAPGRGWVLTARLPFRVAVA